MASTGEVWKLGHRPALDGVRGIAVLLVVASHGVKGQLLSAGPVGVAVFFVLSGFLITTLLLDEHDANGGRFSLAGFYRRRALRLLPALVVFLGVMLLLQVAWAPIFATPAQVLPVLVYLGNLPKVWDLPVGALGHTWSLAVEEQFYIVFPLLLTVLLRGSRRIVWGVLAGLCLLSLGVRVGLWLADADATRVYFATDTNMGLLLLGCLTALSMRGRPIGAARPWLAAPALLGVAALSLAGDTAASRALGPIAAAALTVIIIVAVVRADYSGWLQARWIVLVGRRSYGFYLWHYPFLWVLAPRLDLSPLISVPLFAVMAWGLTLLSWRFVEQPFLRLKDHHGNHGGDRVGHAAGRAAGAGGSGEVAAVGSAA